ncbi:MAG: methylated-DNA--[protein]-cysteine S-methyltransferase [Limnochordia bacterium]|jgi:O-6-methylguanine DNA methyltransferase|nr:methylated-DNA--[protein]-cysteine S-methyltransferase [Limnochordia bacterium]MDD2629556.1 methylated-DNA--[protein]-cysteine S-methyltransferase [Limnochordia bacterium]MDD4518811.1 methylated-DNA--[protein]-cysteine S-methyltransferase [Limnochordia bacterium]
MSISSKRFFYSFVAYSLGYLTVVYELDNTAVALGFGKDTCEITSMLEKRLHCPVGLNYRSEGWRFTDQLQSYLAGKRHAFEIDYELYCTPFQRRVFALVSQIPYGSICTYGEIAQKLGTRGYARAVGGALSQNPLPILIPCHRVIGASGRGGFTPDPKIKSYLLALEQDNLP